MSQTIKFFNQGSLFEVQPTIEHSTYASFPGFNDYEIDYASKRINHNIRLVISWKTLCEQIPNLDCEKVKSQGYLVTSEDDPKVIVAEIFVKEYPVGWLAAMGISWSQWLEGFDEDSAAIGIRADEVWADPNYGTALSDGSLYLLDQLDVHPQFRGQHIGQHFTQFTVRILTKSIGDMIFLLADPIPSKYTNGNINCLTDINKLAAYYMQAGFQYVRVQPDGQILLETRGNIVKPSHNIAYLAPETTRMIAVSTNLEHQYPVVLGL